MDQEKLWLLQQASELSQKLKTTQKAFSEEQFKFNLVDAIEKAVEKEKNILEVQVNEIRLQNEKLRTENEMIRGEIASKTFTIRVLESSLNEKNSEGLYEIAKLNSENEFAKHKLEVAAKCEEIYKETIEELKEKLGQIEAKEMTDGESCLVEVLKLEGMRKDAEISRLEEKVKRCEEIEEEFARKNSENSVFSREISFLDESEQGINKKLKEANLIIADREQKIFNFLAEYEKKAPKIREQKENYEKLITSNEELKTSHINALNHSKFLEEKLQTTEDDLKSALEQKETLEKNCKSLCGQLSNVLYSKQTTTDLNFTNIEELIQENLRLSLKFFDIFSQNSLLQSKVSELESRPLIIQEIVEDVDYSKFLSVESSYQHHQNAYNSLLSRSQDLEIEKNSLLQKFAFYESQEKKLRETLEKSRVEKGELLEKIRKLESENKLKNVPLLSFQSQFGYKALYESNLRDYKVEIERLKKYNNELHQALKEGQQQFFTLVGENKQKISELINEKVLVYSEYKKLEIKLLDVEKALERRESDLQEELKKKILPAQIDAKESAAINELIQARDLTEKLNSELEKQKSEIFLLKEENRILHTNLTTASQQANPNSLKSKLEDSMQLSQILKYNCELYQSELKDLRDQNLSLESKLLEAQKDLSESTAKVQVQEKPVEVPVRKNDLNSAIYEEKIVQLLSDLERKDNQIISLVTMLGHREQVSDTMAKIVSVLHKASKLIKK